MNKLLLLTIISLGCCFRLLAQSEGNVWMADNTPWGGSNYGLRFTNGNPEVFYYDTSNTALSTIKASQAICDAAGNPLFFTGGTSCKVYDRMGNIMPNGSNLQYPTPGTTGSLAPLICPHPGNSNQYFVIYQKNGALIYSIVDMSLNGGIGDVISKNTNINGFAGNSGLATVTKLTLVQGCSSVWLVVRSRNAGQFRSYEISAAGLNTTPVISEIGIFPTAWYNGDVIPGKLKASPDGKLLVSTISKHYNVIGGAFPNPKGGIELYDFEKCSGKVKNARIIDSSQHFDGIAFSPDASKVYASSDTNVFQYDLNAGAPSAVLATKTWMLSSPLIPVWIPFCYCDTTQMLIGDLKLASNGKIYMGNNTGHCVSCLPSASSAKYHSIEQPNLAGIAATPIVNSVSFPQGYITGADLPPDIVLPPPLPDTVINEYAVSGCFKTAELLAAGSEGSCFRWQDGSDSATYLANTSGTYHVSYFGSDCRYHVDTIRLQLVPLPEIVQSGYSCPNGYEGTAIIRGADGFAFDYEWLDQDSNIIKSTTGKTTDTATGLNAGIHYLSITTESGCDTTLSFEVISLPEPFASFECDSVICNNKELYFYNTSNAPLYHWSFGDGAEASTKDASHAYKYGGPVDVILEVTNIEGCSDTAMKRIFVRELQLELSASDSLVAKGTTITLRTSAQEPYSIHSWEPAGLFHDATLYNQQIAVWTTQIFTVNGISSELGCEAKAEVKVTVETFMQIPNAFSPNGDGLNDYFVPLITGEGYSLQSFLVFNRWGQCVYKAYQNYGLKGWDGTFKGQALEMGTYFYQIVIDNNQGKQVMNKGEINLIR